MKIKDFIDKFRKLFKKTKKDNQPPTPDPWYGEQPTQHPKRKLNLQPPKLTLPPLPKPTRVIHIPYILKIKRILAGLLFITNLLIIGVSLFQFPVILLIFVPNAWILLDYIWKTRGSEKKWVKKETENADSGPTS